MGSILSSTKKKPSISETDRSVLQLKAQRKKLADQQRLLEARIDKHNEVARALVRENKKDKALFVLKKRRLVEKQQEALSGMLMNVEALVSNVEVEHQQNKVYSALKEGNEALRQLQQTVTVDDVQRVMEDAAEAKAQYEQMSELLGQSLSDVDAEQVEAELQALEDQAVQELPSVPATTPAPKVQEKEPEQELPSVPAGAPVKQQQQQQLEEAEEPERAREPMLAA